MPRVLSIAEAVIFRESLREQRVVFTNGHFDLIHVGHLDYLEQARTYGDALIVGINGDDSTRRLKGVGRPVTPAVERARLIAGLWCVDAAIIFEEITATTLINALRPDVYVKGGDYQDPTKPWPERAGVLAYGGEVHLIPYLPDHSTTAIIAKVKSLPT
jgi:D-beta-D-heptose 7-phosphate kinase/D-beta-D-heptose 1-phosphate adenosyltransferase